MRIDGRAIADQILDTLRAKVSTIKKRGVTPTLAVILVGNDAGSISYIKQKEKAAQGIGAKLLLEQLPETTSLEILDSTIARYNHDPSVHGLIVQRPVPLTGAQKILEKVSSIKDIDGFIQNSPFQVPVARAVLTILTAIHHHLKEKKLITKDFLPWLRSENVAIVGRGETAGRPIAQLFETYQCTPFVIHSKTPQPADILKRATILISCVGKSRVITKSNITGGAIVIAVGLFRGVDGKLHGDYEEDEIKDLASFYTPTPGGVGPVNVAALMQNLVDACMLRAT